MLEDVLLVTIRIRGAAIAGFLVDPPSGHRDSRVYGHITADVRLQPGTRFDRFNGRVLLAGVVLGSGVIGTE